MIERPWKSPASVLIVSRKNQASYVSSNTLNTVPTFETKHLPPPSHPSVTSLNNAATSNKTWVWPAKGRVLIPFSLAKGKKGIDIAGKKGEKIYAAADGKVVYSGHGLASYGNLLIIKHQQNFLTAYGNNSKNLVAEGQYVKAGAIIADMGSVSPGVWGLHFEIRKQGKPVDPMQYLMP